VVLHSIAHVVQKLFSNRLLAPGTLPQTKPTYYKDYSTHGLLKKSKKNSSHEVRREDAAFLKMISNFSTPMTDKALKEYALEENEILRGVINMRDVKILENGEKVFQPTEGEFLLGHPIYVEDAAFLKSMGEKMTLVEYGKMNAGDEDLKLIAEILNEDSIFVKDALLDMEWVESPNSGKRDYTNPEEFTGVATDNKDSFIINGEKIERL